MSRDFPGSAGNRLDGSDVAAIDITGPQITISLWAVFDTPLTGAKWLVGKDGGSASTLQYQVWVNNNAAVMYLGTGPSAGQVASTQTFSAGVWNHILGRLVGIGSFEMGIFLNSLTGNFGTLGANIAHENAILCFGDRAAGTSIPHNGLLAEIGLWDVGLNDAERLCLANKVCPRLVRPGNLRGYWPLWGSGLPERDYSGHGTHVSQVGSVPAGTWHPPTMPYMMG